ncbi:nucleotidyltransferase domain-containing protein [Cellulomonas sp. HD19AZ1]|uniref:nucleotidyltransferase domain-containing protein n=1 Tax=Cellulomonas sp. HD19AZ1 TaxID=2559593 RepID=UPI00107070D7|nr:nucleotidyltransferase domain-containing protein [Cellulomonas sp. HD19AZ1]TFH71199.1 nucleotidyltransferase domain-containing protein [Cellulomonas sp. HD19AZ1]
MIDESREDSTVVDYRRRMDITRPLAVVAPTLDADVLYRLLRAEEVAFTAGQLQRLIPERSVDGVRRTLERLSRQGVVNAVHVGHAITYRLNSDHLAVPGLRLLAAQPAELVDRMARQLDTWPVQPLYASIFGSWARSQTTETSDVDLLVILPTAAADEVEAFVRDLEDRVHAWTGNDARVLLLDQEQVRDESLRPVLQNAQRDGIRVAGDEHWLRRALRRAAAQS